MKVSVVLVALILNTIEDVVGIRCYQCNYVEGEENGQSDCETSPPEKYLQNCRSGEESEMKTDYADKIVEMSIVKSNASSEKRPGFPGKAMYDIICVKGTGERNGSKIVGRGCGVTGKPEDFNGRCDSIKKTFCDRLGCYKNRQMCYCTHDGCNSAGSLSHIGVFFTSILGFVFIFLKF